MPIFNTWASQQDPSNLSPLDRLLNQYIQKSDAPAAYLMRGDPQGLWKDLNTPKPVNMAQDMTDVALNANPIMGLIGATAYHGSPYLFKQFDPKKIGTGVGNTMRGEGTYFSENPAIAQEYLAPKGNSATSNFLYKDKPIDPNNEMMRSAAFGLNYFKGDKEKILGMYKPEYYNSSSGKEFKKYVETMNFEDIKPKGTFYKVDIPDKDIPKMLDWEKPLSEQSPQIQKSWEKLVPKLLENNPRVNEFPGDNAARALQNSLVNRNEATLGDLYGALQGVSGYEASNILKQNGIKGIKYLGAEDGIPTSQNYVVFDPRKVKILEKKTTGLLGD